MSTGPVGCCVHVHHQQNQRKHQRKRTDAAKEERQPSSKKVTMTSDVRVKMWPCRIPYLARSSAYMRRSTEPTKHVPLASSTVGVPSTRSPVENCQTSLRCRHTIIPETLSKKIIRSDLFKFSCSLTEDHSDASDHSTKVAEYMNASLAVGWRKRWCDLRSGFGGADGVVDGAKDNHRLGFDGADLLP